MAQAAGHDINYIALAGALAHFGRAGGKPTPPINLVGDFGGGGMFMAFGIVCGVLEAQRSGKGQVIDVAMVDGTATLMSMMWGLKQIGVWDEELGTNVLDTGAPFYDTYETKDGKFVSLGSLEPQFYAELLAEARPRRAKGLPAQMDQSGWDTLRTRFTELFKTKTRDEWDEILARQRRVLRAGAHDDARRRTTRTSRRARRSSSATACRSPRPRRASRARAARGAALGAVAGPAHRRGARRLGSRRRRRGEAARDRRDRLIERGDQPSVDGVDEVLHARERRSSAASSARGHGDVADLAAGPRRLAVVVQVRARDREHRVAVGHVADAVDHRARRRAPRSSRAASRGSRAGGSRTGSSPRLRSSSARSCARGARSRWRAARRRRRTARRSTRRRSRARRAAAGCTPRRAPAARRRAAAPARASGAGCRRGAWFSTTGQHAISPSRPRTARIDSSRSNGTNPSRISGTPPSSRPRGVDVGRGAQHDLALAVVAAAPRLQHRGQPERVDRGVERRRGRRRRGTARSRSRARGTSPSRRAGPGRRRARAAGGSTGASRAERARGRRRARLPTRT